MKEKVNQGFISSIVSVVILLLLAVFWGFYEREWLLSFGRAENMYNRGIVFLSNADYSNEDTDGNIYTINIYDIVDLDTEVGNNHKLYSVAIDGLASDKETITYGYAYLEAKANDKNIQKLVDAYKEDPEAFIKESHVIFVDVQKATFEDQSTLSEFSNIIFENNSEAIAHVDNRYFLVVTSVWYELLWVYGILAVLIIIPIGILFSAFNNRKLNKLNYDKLYELDPSLKENISDLPNRATYSDPVIGAFIYKDHLILTKKSFRIFSFEQMRWTYYTERKTRYYGVITVATVYMLNVFSQIDGKHVNQSIFVTNNKKQKNNVEELLGYIYTHYPDVLVGYNAETQAAYAVIKSNQ